MTPEQRLEQLGLTLPALSTPIANYVPYRLAGNLLYLSGQGPKRLDGTYRVGRLGRDISVEEAYREARMVGLGLLAAAKAALGSLERIEAVIKLLGMVNAGRTSPTIPRSSTAARIFRRYTGEAGRHARSAVGMGSPNRIGRDRGHPAVEE